MRVRFGLGSRFAARARVRVSSVHTSSLVKGRVKSSSKPPDCVEVAPPPSERTPPASSSAAPPAAG